MQGFFAFAPLCLGIKVISIGIGARVRSGITHGYSCPSQVGKVACAAENRGSDRKGAVNKAPAHLVENVCARQSLARLKDCITGECARPLHGQMAIWMDHDPVFPSRNPFHTARIVELAVLDDDYVAVGETDVTGFRIDSCKFAGASHRWRCLHDATRQENGSQQKQ